MIIDMRLSKFIVAAIGLTITQCSFAQLSQSAQSQDALPDDVTQFVMRRNLCEHLRGEISDNPTADFIRSVNESCEGTDHQLEVLKQKYRSNPFVMSKLSVLELHIEAQNY